MTQEQKIQEALKKLKDVTRGTEYEKKIYLAGGAVRDELMGKSIKDIDLVVEGASIYAGIECASFIAKKLGIYRENSNPVIFPRFGTAKLTLRNGVNIEFVAPRIEKYDGVSRKPLVEVGTLKDDAYRRDFTINSMMKRLSDDEILDLTGKGRKDLERKFLQTTSDPDWIFSEDPLRILRAVRFALKYNLEVPFSLIRSMKKQSSKLKNISNERIKDELDKILVLPKPSRAFRLFESTNILEYVLPELKKLVGVTQNKYHVDDAFRHTLAVLDKTPPEIIRRLGALFHDIGKAATRTDKEGKIQFIGHQFVGALIAEEAMRRLKYSNDDIKQVVPIVKNHMDLKSFGDDTANMKEKSLRKFIFRVGESLEKILDVIHADNISHSEHGAMPNQIDNIRQKISKLNIQEILSTKSILDGTEIAMLGAKGKEIGQVKERILEKVLENPSFSRREAENLAKNLIESFNRKKK